MGLPKIPFPSRAEIKTRFSYWKTLSKSQKASLVSLIILLFALPAAVIIVLAPRIPLFSGAAPATAPTTEPTPFPTHSSPPPPEPTPFSKCGQECVSDTGITCASGLSCYSTGPSPFPTGGGICVNKACPSDPDCVCDAPTPTPVPTPTPTPTHTETPVSTPTASPTASPIPIPSLTPDPSNSSPIIWTRAFRIGRIGRDYNGSVLALDRDGDALVMQITGLPKGLKQEPCTFKKVQRISTLTCPVRGVPEEYGIFSVGVIAGDPRGGRTTKNIMLIILPKNFWPTL